MNFGLILVAFLLLAGTIFGIFMIAGANQTTYVDTFGDVQGNQTNATQGTIGNVTAPLGGAAGGLALLFGFFIVVIAVVYLLKVVGSSSYVGRR